MNFIILFLFLVANHNHVGSYRPVHNPKDVNWLFRYSNFKGQDFCQTNNPQCCPNRDDACAVPIHGTLCYCDEFCDRDINADCCPDFLPVCRGIYPPEHPQEFKRKVECKYSNYDKKLQNSLKCSSFILKTS